MSLNGTRVLVIGLGISGQSAVRFLLKRGAIVSALDSNPRLHENQEITELCANGMTFFQEKEFVEIGDIRDYGLIIVSPGICPTHFLYRKATEHGIEVIGEVELACRSIRQKCLGVTGTNGKTTVTLMTNHVLQKAGFKAKALGNIGTPLTAALDEGDEAADIFVIELSSFQLETLKMKCLDGGVILNITPDHLDRYPSMEAYAAAKIGMGKNLKPGKELFIGESCLRDFPSLFKNLHFKIYGYDGSDDLYTDTQHVYFHGEKIFSLPEKFRGKRSHEVENLMASYALCRVLSISPEEFLNGIASFQKPAHRIEFVCAIGGVNYYDDSKGTNIDAVIRAVEGLEGQIILIAGGVDKGFPYTAWIDTFKGKVKAVCAIGQSKEKIKSDIGAVIPVSLFSDLDQAVASAAGMAQAGDNVLLSPGCSSFDMFKDYAHRGQEFQRIIHAL